jgi:hypothetical protein
MNAVLKDEVGGGQQVDNAAEKFIPLPPIPGIRSRDR